MQHIAIFASGSGSNAEKIIQHFSSQTLIKVSLVVCNRKEAGIWDIAKSHNIPSAYFPKSKLYDSNDIIKILQAHHCNWIVLAGFLLKIPASVLEAYPNKIINIHPALLPKFGVKGMYGMHVHKAVQEAGETETGISIHLANENYDEGQMIAQHRCELNKSDDAEDIRAKVQALEHKFFAIEIEQYIRKNSGIES